MPTTSIPVSAVVATKDRAESLARTLDSLAAQDICPCELIVVDGSVNDDTRRALEPWEEHLGRRCSLRWLRADKVGAAAQRNQGVACATQPFVWFCDDDIRFAPGCVRLLWRAISSDATLGGASAMIVNQRFHPPGAVGRMVLALVNGRREDSYAGRILGPALNVLPEDGDALPEVVPVEWLNTTCTIYRREALPQPVFDPVFTGYSMMEDVTLSLRVGRTWRLANARTARIVHDSQPGAHKSDARALATMECVNRHYVMTEILGRRGIAANMRLWAWEGVRLFTMAARSDTRAQTWPTFRGQMDGLRQICGGRS